MPVSYTKPGYTCTPFEVLGPPMAFLIAATFSRVRHASLRPCLHVNTAGSNSQPSGSKIMPSATPSSASHFFRSASMMSVRSASLMASVIIGLPSLSLGAIWLNATGIHWPIARFESPVRMAGSPEMIPSKLVG